MDSPCDTVIGDRDLLTEILLRLPVKQVIQCKCVCKKWLSLICNTKFRYSHTCRLYHKYNNNPPPTALLVQNFADTKAQRASIVPLHANNNNGNKIFFHLDLDGCNYRSSIMHSCNGLLLWNVIPTPQPGPTSEDSRARHFRIQNPAMSDDHCVYLDYPVGDVDSPDGDDIFEPFELKAYLVFEPLKQPLSYKVILFGQMDPSVRYHGRRVEFKVLNPRIEIRLYSSETCGWSEVICNLPDGLRVTEGVYCNGVIHWFRLDDDNSVYFDTNRLCFDKLPAVPSVDDSCVKYFGECRGRLHLILSDTLEFDIWELEEDYSSWVARYRVNLNRMHDGESALWWNVSSNPFSVLSFVHRQEEEEENSMLVLFKDGKIMSYSLEDYGLRVLCKIYRDEVSRSIHQYFETMLCVGNS
ncbi:hypothetical protein HN51_048878 [Arachis hypogaea]|uniref:F-box domain-containing protein n=1 Tax=Arachis hypogaea TaxID=3818 RepID=A0A445E922_ARAHY|nr:uncharacterized protein LOC107627929 [Arachis ipaensis]QHO25515.1 uncharacterized protein DS421_12g381700 [Arachis hypogaea]RYR71775.1 hypothetical protein Ahy_A02g005997 [Arachis hypogaea]